MKKNLLLSVATLICTMLCISVIIIFLASTAAFVYWHINPEFFADYSLIAVNPRPDNFFAYTVNTSWTIGNEEAVNQFTMNKIKAPFLYLLYFQSAAIGLIIFMIIKEFLNIIKSVKRIHSFRIRNIKSFRRIGKYLFIFFILSSFYIVIAEQGEFYGFYFHLTPLFLMLFVYILGEVFKEGNGLLEENQLTV